ncbi:selenocysteine-specific translation elongation factor, partial [candidate division KSB1 bacterium]|nr:selenocysteine-specific translation elongation factor [candidate division KSB1 bacterium]
MTHVIIGTAGHIDHGKTALVKVLTGVDTDRLKDEKARGLTIDLGFAHIGDRATIIDVPGHEKFIRNMVAGVSTVDLVLFVVAADDGVMPQTREHLDILKILRIKKGIIAITKSDLVEAEWLSLVKEEVSNLVQDTFLATAPMIAVSSTTGDGISELKSELENELVNLKLERDRGMFWMPVDRSFTMKGFGTVVTGSVLSGETQVGTSLELLPHQKLVKIRGLQSHNETVEKVTAGDRAAINLQAVEKQEIQRGDVLAEANYFKPSQRMDAKVELLPSAPRALKSNARIRLHLGTTEIMARISILKQKKIEPEESAYLQFHLEKPACSRRLDPFVIRQYSPMMTIGGGTILNPNAPRHKLSDPTVLEELKALEKENPEEVIEHKLLSANFTPLTVERIVSEIAVPKDTTQQILQDLENQDKVVTISKNAQISVIHRNNFDKLVELIKNTLAEFHKKNPTKLGLNKTEMTKSLKTKVDGELLDYALTDLKNRKLLKETEGSVSLYDH